MRASAADHLPLTPLLYAYFAAGLPSPGALGRLAGLGPRFAAVLSASARFLYPAFLDRASDADFADAIARFYEAVVRPPLHLETLRNRAGFVRHGVGYLLRGRDPLPMKMENLLSPAGAYHVPGLGPAFWSALVQATQPARLPGWTPETVAGLRRLGLARWRTGAGPGAVYAALQSAGAEVRARLPELTAVQVDHFLTLVAAMPGRDLWEAAKPQAAEEIDPVTVAVQRERVRTPARERIKQRGAALARAHEELETGLARRDGKRLGAALAVADPDGMGRSPLAWGQHGETLTLWIGRLWEADDPYAMLASFWEADPLPGAGLWLPAAVLHLRNAQHFAPWNDAVRQGCAFLDDSADGAEPAAVRYRLFNEAVAALRASHHLHPLEVAAVLSAIAPRETASPRSAHAEFSGFCGDTFRFLAEMGHNNNRAWMERQRDRYRFVVREPLIELCEAIVRRYVAPVLRGVYGWDLDTEPRSGRALTSVCRNAYGRGDPYNTTLWIAFGARGKRRDAAQFFVRLDANGVSFGLRIGRMARAAARLFKHNLQQNADVLFRALADRGALATHRFGDADSPKLEAPLSSAADLRQWAAGRSFEASRSLPADAPLLGGDDLVGEILLTFDRLLPLFGCAVEANASEFLTGRLGMKPVGDGFSEADFRSATYLGDDWLRQARGLLELKRQLILQGVPGTGKTHVARCLARLLARGQMDAVRLVQFHPAYSYEEFVEGIRVKSVAVDGRHDVSYPVEDGLLCAFAAEAERRPSQPYVLLVDEINRGNLPRIFGELLYLLEYRGQEVTLPCSRRPFRLPANLYLLGTMNAADRSVALVDRALRRRFSFLEMPPDAGVLAAWLTANAADAAFAGRVLTLFEKLNARLRTDLGAQAQIGHSYFMVPHLDESRLRMVWQHHVRPLLEEQFAGQPQRLAGYELDGLMSEARGERRRVATTVL